MSSPRRIQRDEIKLRDGRTLAYYNICVSPNNNANANANNANRSKISLSSSQTSSSRSFVPSTMKTFDADNAAVSSSLSSSSSLQQHPQKSPHYIFAFHAMFMTGQAFLPKEERRTNKTNRHSKRVRKLRSSTMSSSDAVSSFDKDLQSSSSSSKNIDNDNTNKDYILVSLDRPGYAGSSSIEIGQYTYRDFARDIEELADHLGARTFSVVGHSSGGPNALACAYFLSNRVTSVAILAGDPEYKAAAAAAAAAAADPPPPQNNNEDPGSSHSEKTTVMDIPSTGPVFDFCMGTLLPAVMWPVTPFYKVSNGLKNDFTLERQPYPFQTENIQQPTLCVLGHDDAILKREVAIWVHNRLPNSTLWELPDKGHMDLIQPDVLETVFEELVCMSRSKYYTEKI